jgi:hypothetical protein
MNSPRDRWIIARLLSGSEVNGELEHVSDSTRRLCDHLAMIPVKKRPDALAAFLKSVPEPKERELVLALAEIRPEDPAPEEPARIYATLADVAETISEQQWLWEGWIAFGVLNVLASDPGVGKSRTSMDLARRLWFADPWPDGKLNILPAKTLTLWIQGDRNFAEMLKTARDFGLPDEAVALGSAPEEPFGSLDLDDLKTLDAIARRIQASGARLTIIDTVAMTTGRNLSLPEEARNFFAPLLEMCRQTGVALLALTHLSAHKEALGRRIVEKARVVMKMTNPDPGQPNRRRLWVDKSAVVKPAPLGITMKTPGNEYDFNPPGGPEQDPDRRAKESGPVGRPPTKTDEAKAFILEKLATGDQKTCELVREWTTSGGSRGTFFTARAQLQDEGRILVDITEKPQVMMLFTGTPDAAESPGSAEGDGDEDPNDVSY